MGELEELELENFHRKKYCGFLSTGVLVSGFKAVLRSEPLAGNNQSQVICCARVSFTTSVLLLVGITEVYIYNLN